MLLEPKTVCELCILFILVLISRSGWAEEIPWIWDHANPPPQVKHVAILTQHLLFKDGRILHRGRATHSKIDSAALITPVVHIQIDNFNVAPIPVNSHDEILDAVLNASTASTSGWVQLDYEAKPSHREFYLGLVHDIKMALPGNIKLSVTALAWWCRSDKWLNNLDADEVVPMYFRMGAETKRINEILLNSPNVLNKRCNATVAGFSVQERPSKTITDRYPKIYWFDYTGWKGNKAWPLSATY